MVRHEHESHRSSFVPLAEWAATRLGNDAECLWHYGWTGDDRYFSYALIRPATGDGYGLKLLAREFDLPAPLRTMAAKLPEVAEHSNQPPLRRVAVRRAEAHDRQGTLEGVPL